jgi:hypothetical protein
MRAYQFTTEDEDYRMDHRAPMHDSGSPLHDVTGTYPDDIYGPKAIQYYGTREPWDSRSIRVIQLSRNKPNQTIQIFRAVPKEVKSNTINPGDWVTASKEYAAQHGRGLGKYKVLTKIVPAKTLFTNGDSIHEWGYDPGGADEPVAEGVPQPGESSGAPKNFGPGAKIETRQMTVKQLISAVPGVPYYRHVVDDWDAKDYNSWNVTTKTIEYATYLRDHPESLSQLPPILVLNGKFEDGAHRVSAIWLLQQRMDTKNPIWANAKLNVQFIQQPVAEDTADEIYK